MFWVVSCSPSRVITIHRKKGSADGSISTDLRAKPPQDPMFTHSEHVVTSGENCRFAVPRPPFTLLTVIIGSSW